MILTSLPEWCLLQRIAIATGGVKGRLARLGPKRSSSSSNQVLLGYIGNNDLAFLETELRSLLMWETPYAQSVQSTFDQLSRELKSLCGALENLVNSALLIGKEANPDSDDSLDPAKGYTTHYPKLWRLWTCLENSWNCGERFLFNLVHGPNHQLFLVHTDQASQLLATVTSCNELLLQLSVPKDTFSIPRSTSTYERGSGLPEQAIFVLETLFEEFSRCSSDHELLLCPSREDSGHSSHATVDLFLTCSQSPNQRHETRFLPLETQHCLKEVENLCSDIHMSTKGTLLQLILKHRGLFNITNLPSPRSHTQVQSLEDLLPKGIFRRIGVAHCRRSVFNSKEKTALALRLAKYFLAFFDAGGVLPSWDSQRIFLAAPRGSPLQDGQLYVGFVPPFDDEVECSNQFGNPIFLGFAKLLLEIEEGQKIDLSHCANVYSQVGELCSRIAKLQADGRNHYAEAVRHCVLPSPSPHDGEDDKTAVQRILSEQVIGYLEADLKPTGLPHNKRRRSSSIQQSSTSADTPSQRRKTEHSNVEGYASSTISGSYCSESPVDVPIEPLAQSELSGRLVETISGQPRQCSEDKDGYIHRSELLSGREQEATVKWLDKFKLLRSQVLIHGSQPTIRIAVLDTGYEPDRMQNARTSRKVQRRWKDFLGVSTLSRSTSEGSMAMEVDGPATKLISPATEPLDEDENLHGTGIVNLLHDLLPDSEIYVGRVTKDVAGLAKASRDIAAAITHAADPHGWNADIITMSFGSTFRSRDIEDAISSAQTLRNRCILFFAAAGNDGGNYSELYPAALESVISVRGTYGTSEFIGRYNPDPQPDGEGRPLFGTLAHRVPCGPNDEEMSGCSIATPILAATAAVFIEYATSYTNREDWRKRQDWREARERILLILKTRVGMEQLFKSIAGKANAANHRYYIAPERLFSTGQLGEKGWFHPIENVCSIINVPE